MRRSKGRAAARRWAAPVCRRVRRCAPKCGRVERNAVPAADREPDKSSDTAVTGALPVPPVPRAAQVTGGGRRIGRALSVALAQEGYAVAIHHHDSKTEAEALAIEITRAGGKAVTLAADLSDESAVAELLPRAMSVLGPIGCLVNNASIFENDTVRSEEHTSELQSPYDLVCRLLLE